MKTLYEELKFHFEKMSKEEIENEYEELKKFEYGPTVEEYLKEVKKFYDKQMHENKSFLEFIDKLEKNPENFRITKSQSSSLRKFLKKELINDKTGEILNSKDIKALIDFDKINKYKESFGYYQIVTSELDMDDRKVIDTYHGLSRIEDQFRVMKSDLETRPMYVRTKEHINAHILICLLSLIIIRIIQNMR